MNIFDLVFPLTSLAVCYVLFHLYRQINSMKKFAGARKNLLLSEKFSRQSFFFIFLGLALSVIPLLMFADTSNPILMLLFVISYLSILVGLVFLYEGMRKPHV